jgi:hypothetical protein
VKLLKTKALSLLLISCTLCSLFTFAQDADIAPAAPRERYSYPLKSSRNPFYLNIPSYSFETRNTTPQWKVIQDLKTPLPIIEIDQRKTITLQRPSGTATSGFLPTFTQILPATRKNYYHNGNFRRGNDGVFYYQMVLVSADGSESIAGWISGKDILSPVPKSLLQNTQTEAGFSNCQGLGTCPPSPSTEIADLYERLKVIRGIKSPLVKYACPVGGTGPAVITSEHNMQRKHPVLNYVRPHHGIDFGHGGASAPPIQAVAAGKVISSGMAGGFGRRVVIETDDGYIMTYNHLAYVARNCGVPAVGARLERGAKLGCMGMTGVSTGVHLHFEVYKSKADFEAKRSINPKTLIDFNQACAGRFSHAKK